MSTSNSSLVSLSYEDLMQNLQIIPHCFSMQENRSASNERYNLRLKLQGLDPNFNPASFLSNPLEIHLAHGLAYTVGSALGSIPPTVDTCLAAFLVPNKAGLTAGARAWSKHAHRSQPQPGPSSSDSSSQAVDADLGATSTMPVASGWWGIPSGPVSIINEKALALFWKVINSVTWRNLHWLPHSVLVYEVRVEEGYGMRWSQDQSAVLDESDSGNHTDNVRNAENMQSRPWMFRGFVEPMMENGHEVGWRH